MEKRINGYVPQSIKTTRAERMLTAHAHLARARKRTILLLAPILLFLVGLAVLFAINGRFRENRILLLVLFVVFFAAVLFSALFFVVGHVIYGGSPDSQRIDRILLRYVRGLLGDTYRMYEREIIGRDRDRLLCRYAIEYINDFRLLEGEREKLTAKGALASEAEAIRRRYEDFITYVISGDREAERYISHRQSMAKVLEKWRHKNLSRYDKPQRIIIEENIKRVTRTATEQYEYFLTHVGMREYIMLLNDVLYHDITAERSLWKPLPVKKKYKAFCKVVKQIEENNPSKMLGAARGGPLFDHALALENYKQFVKAYSTEACPTLRWEFEVYEEELAAAQKAQDTCWKCGEKYHPRYRPVREKCKHFICNKCGVCYCSSPQSRRRRDDKKRKSKSRT